jgi:hypothetical protein
LRRALGFKLELAGHLLPQLVSYLDSAGAATVTSDLAIRAGAVTVTVLVLGSPGGDQHR